MLEFSKRCAYWLVAGVGFDLSQRFLDHWIDLLTDRYAIMAWLK